MVDLQLTHQELAVMTKIEAKNHFERVVQRLGVLPNKLYWAHSVIFITVYEENWKHVRNCSQQQGKRFSLLFVTESPS